MPHDPSECSRCCWTGEWLGYVKLDDGETVRWIRNNRLIRSFCASLDAVAGLRKQVQEHSSGDAPPPLWSHRWLPYVKRWQYVNHCQGISSTSSEHLPAACVIDVAMAVLGDKKESDE